jgi:peptidoglycan/LPS O-acetylase OafA/YrhL
MRPSANESPNLDALRATAVLCVLLSHLSDTITGGLGDFAWHVGRLGVLMFFVHTSLVLMFSMERLKLDGWALAGTFYIRRWFRIYPLSIVCVVFMYFWMRSFWAPARAWTGADLWADLTLTQNLFSRDNVIGVLWSLPLEVQMYLFLPALFLLGRRLSIRWMFGIWLAALPLGAIASRVSDRINVFEYAPCFIAGVLAWRLIRRGNAPKLPSWLWPIAMVSPGVIWMIAPPEPQQNLIHRWLVCIALALMIPAFKELTWKPLNVFSHVVAKYSYGIYLSHVCVFVFVYYAKKFYPSVPVSAVWTCCAVMVLGIPVVLYHCIEEPFIGLGRRISQRWLGFYQTKQAAPVAGLFPRVRDLGIE